MTSPETISETRGVIRTGPWLALTVAVGVVLGILFLTWPEIDLYAAGLFHADGKFLLQDSWLIWLFKRILRPGITIVTVVLVLWVIGRAIFERPRKLQTLKPLAFIALCLALGPGLLVNGVLKENWGRARPKQIVEFAGNKQFTPPLVITDQCNRNCSFVSGDASFAFAALSLAMLAGRRRRAWVVAALGFGLVIGVFRMTVGAHFLSDVLFAGVFTTLTILIVYRWLLEGRGGSDLGLLTHAWRHSRDRAARNAAGGDSLDMFR